MRQLTLLGWGILTLSLASFWTLPAQEPTRWRNRKETQAVSK
jgi:hypothetical protein